MPHPAAAVTIEAADAGDLAPWLGLRCQLRPDGSPPEHQQEIEDQLQHPGRYWAWIAWQQGQAVALAEAALRHDYVNGTGSSPVAFLEGLYVAPAARRQGVARALLAAVAQWAQQQDCSELASDTAIDNLASQAMHEALGFAETERVVFYRQRL